MLVYSEKLSTETFETYNELLKLTETHKIEDDYKTNIEPDERPLNLLPSDTAFHENRSKFHEWIVKIAAEQKAKYEQIPIKDKIYPNNFYAATKKSKFDRKLIEMFTILPLTSSIMNPTFNKKGVDTPTSSTTESYFRIIKRGLFKVDKNIRIDRWLEIHLKYLLGRLKAAAKQIDDVIDESESEDDGLIVDEFDSEYEIEYESDTDDEYSSESSNENQPAKSDPFDSCLKHENWMGMNDDAEAPATTFTRRSRSSILNKGCEANPFLPVLANGCEYRYDGVEVSIYRTCAMDCFLQIFLAIYVDSPKCKAIMMQLDDRFKSIVKLIQMPRGIKKTYEERGEFLRKVFSNYCDINDRGVKYRIENATTEIEETELYKRLVRPTKFIKETKHEVQLNCDTGIHTMWDLISKYSY